MPRGRFASRDRSTNKQYWDMDCAHRNFWDLLFPWCDAEGRQDGDPAIIKGLVCPLADWTIEQVEEMLKKFESIKRHDGLGWIIRYREDGKYVLWCVGFEENQRGLRKEKEAKGRYGYSDYPPPPANLMIKAKQSIIEPKSEIRTDDLKIAAMIKLYEEKTGRTLTPTDYERIKDFADHYPDGWFEKAVDEAVKNNARSPMRYIEKTMEHWLVKERPVETSTDNQGITVI